MTLFSSFKYKVIAAGSVVLIGLFAALKWLYASNQAKKEKIHSLKNEAKIVKVKTNIVKDVSEYKGYQEAIDLEIQRLAKVTNDAKNKRNAKVKNESDDNDHSFTSIRV